MLIVCEHSLDSPQLHCLFLPRGLLSTPMGLDNAVIVSIWKYNISNPQCSLTFLRERYLHRCREKPFSIRAYIMSAVGIDVASVHKLFAYRIVSTVSTDIVSRHTKYCRIAYGITR